MFIHLFSWQGQETRRSRVQALLARGVVCGFVREADETAVSSRRANTLRARIAGDVRFRILRGEKSTHLSTDKSGFFELSVPLVRNVKYASQVKRTSCVKCAFGTICGTLNSTLRPWRNTSLGRKPKLHCGLPQLHFLYTRLTP